MFEETVEVSGWHAAWLSRTLPAFRTYSHLISYVLSTAIVALGLLGFFGIRRSLRQFREGETSADTRAALYKRANKRALKVCRGHFYIANIYLLNILVIALVDAYIGVVVLGKDTKQHPETWTTGFLIQVAAYCVYISFLFAGALILAPLAQMVAITWVLARFARKHGANSLADYIPEARIFSTSIAQFLCMVCFFLTAWWPPIGDSNPMTRWLVLQASLGSAIAWLDASFAFNFCAKRLASNDLKFSTGGVAEIVRMFARTVQVVHLEKAKSGDILPRYEEVPRESNGTAEETLRL